MNKKALALSFLWVLLLTMFVPNAFATDVPNQGHYIVESIGDPETVDPAWAYDTASASLIFNVYDPLIFFVRESMEDFVGLVAEDGWLANQAPDAAAPEGTNNTWYFEIRDGIYFQPWQDADDVWHAPALLTTEDVEYSFERWMVQDRSGGPTWMINEPLYGDGWPDKSGWAEDSSCPINLAVQSNSTHVWFNLALPYPPLVFQQIICQSWASILSKDFCVYWGDWDGDWSDWKDYEDPALSPLDDAGYVMCGSGPFMLDYWIHGAEWSIVAFKLNNGERTDPYVATYEYWQGWPDAHSSRSLDRATEKVVYEWGTRLADFKAGTADTVYVPRQYISMVEGEPGIRGLADIPTLAMDAMFFNFNINPDSQYIGSGSYPDGIPVDFFSDVNIRKAFAYMFNYTKFLEEVWLNEAIQPGSPVIEGLPYYNPDNPKYYCDLTKAEEYFIAASNTEGGVAEGIWDTGFYLKVAYNTGNVPRQTTAEWIRDNLAEINPLFEADIIGITWSSYLGELWFYPNFQSVLPLFIIGWLADYPDPHNWVTPYMYTYGDFAYPARYSNATVDDLIGIGITTPDLPWTEVEDLENITEVYSSPVCSNWTDPNTGYKYHCIDWIDSDQDGVLSQDDYVCMHCYEGPPGQVCKSKWYHVNNLSHKSVTVAVTIEFNRKWIYYALQLLFYLDCPSIAQDQALGRRWERDWTQGWYDNPIYPGAYYYERWKGLNGDINGDNTVDSLDRGKVNNFWYIPPTAGPAGYYEPMADINPDLKYVEAGLPVLHKVGEVVAAGDGSTTVFDLDFERVKEGTDKIYLDEVLQTIGVDYTIDYETGTITFTTAPGSGVQITADYDYVHPSVGRVIDSDLATVSVHWLETVP